MSYVSQMRINKTPHPIGAMLYGTCSSPASEQHKVVDLSDFDRFKTGITIQVKFVNTNTAEDPTLNVNNTGRIAIHRTSLGQGISWVAGEVVLFTYDGSVWMMGQTCMGDEVTREEIARVFSD